ncbi:MAG: glycosyltransferase [Myxococcales bacterium]|nr:glycosyltransferase [Myxococcales bacterium]
MDRPKVTVYVTNYNYGRYLRQSIESVLNQTLKDIELIIIDDGSSDESSQMLGDYEGMENVFVIFQEQRGLTKASNLALKMARGDYIVRLDADDYFVLDALESLATVLDQSPDVVMVFPDYFEVDESGTIVAEVRRHDFGREVTLLDQPAHGACTMFRRSAMLKVKGYDESFICQDGYDMWLKLTHEHNVANINRPLFHYRKHGHSLSRNEERILKTRAAIMSKHVQSRGLEPLRTWAVIPVRGASADPRSIPLRDLGGKPLIEWTLDAALASTVLEQIIVSTPDQVVRAHVKARYGDRIRAVDRPRDLARINTSVVPTIQNALEQVSGSMSPPDAAMVLFVEAPFRSGLYIDKAVHAMQLYGVDIVDAIRLDDRIYYKHHGEGLEPLRGNDVLRLERDDLYRQVGGMSLARHETLMASGSLFAGRIGHIELDQKASFMIQSELDWLIAESLANTES